MEVLGCWPRRRSPFGPGRYRLLETVRQYAAQQLEDSPAAAHGTRVAHRDYYLALAESAAHELIAHRQAEWLDRLERELDNLRAAIAFGLKQPDPMPGIRLVTSLRVFWKARGHAAEGADALRMFLAVPAARGATLVRARALAAAAYLLDQTGGYELADKYCQEGLAIARSADALLTADLLYVRAYILLRRGQHDAALTLIEEGLGLAYPLAQPHLTACLLAARAFAVDVEGDHAAAARDAAESLRLYRQAGDRLQAGTMAGNLGYAELSLGDLDSARRHLLESLDIARALNDQYGVVYETFNLGLAEYLNGSLSAAEALFAESLDLAARMRMTASTAYALIGLAIADNGRSGPGRSARLHGAADQALAVLGETLEPLEKGLCDLDRQRLRSAMGAEAFQAEYATGTSLTADEVLALAIGNQD
jgi:tetratricopeptide (TPR) repeat protein